MTFAERLKELRKLEDLNQSQLADKIGIADSTISAYEMDRFTPSVLILCCFADYFHVTTDYLLGRSEESNVQPAIHKLTK